MESTPAYTTEVLKIPSVVTCPDGSTFKVKTLESGRNCRFCGRFIPDVLVDFGSGWKPPVIQHPCGCKESLLDDRDAMRPYTPPPRYADVVDQIDTSAYLDAIAAGFGFYIYGANGTGKTALAYAIAKSATKAQIKAEVVNLQKIMELDLDARNERIARMRRMPLLIIDDLGKERASDYFASILFDILRERNERKLPTVITSNFSRGQIAKWLNPFNEKGNGIASRLNEDFTVVEKNGRDMRL